MNTANLWSHYGMHCGPCQKRTTQGRKRKNERDLKSPKPSCQVGLTGVLLGRGSVSLNLHPREGRETVKSDLEKGVHPNMYVFANSPMLKEY